MDGQGAMSKSSGIQEKTFIVESDDASRMEESDDEHNSWCELCGDGGELILCDRYVSDTEFGAGIQVGCGHEKNVLLKTDRCARSYHLECLDVKSAECLPDPYHCPVCLGTIVCS